MGLETLSDATRRYRLKNADMSNRGVADVLALEHSAGDYKGKPNCCFFCGGDLVAIRTKKDEIAIFHVWQRFQTRMETIGERIP